MVIKKGAEVSRLSGAESVVHQTSSSTTTVLVLVLVVHLLLSIIELS